MCEAVPSQTAPNQEIFKKLWFDDDYCPECNQGVKHCKRCGRVIYPLTPTRPPYINETVDLSLYKTWASHGCF